MTSHIAEVYLQLEADTWQFRDTENVRSIKVVGYTQKRPTRPRPGSVVVKLEVQVPDAAFLPLRPAAKVVVPDELTQHVPVEVEATAP